MPSPSPPGDAPFTWLLRKEWRELMTSRSWWVFLTLMGPLVGVTFIGAVRTYGEASGVGGTAAGVGEAFSPLIGVWAPTFSACELAAAFLLPFVAIGLVAGDRQSGALKIELQGPVPTSGRVAAKSLILLAGWGLASLPVCLGLILWTSYGGTLFPAELATVALGHVLNAGLTVALAAAAASLTEHPSSAAIVTLSVTVGTWILNFIAAVQGGVLETLAGYTPTAVVAEFQHGLIRLSVLLVTLVLILAGLSVSAIWMRLGISVHRRIGESIGVAAAASLVMVLASFAFPSWDLSENRGNSFSKSDEAALRRVRGPLRLRVHLAAEDPRRVDFEHKVLGKLRRVVAAVHVEYTAATSIGMFEQTSEHYGEIDYDLDGKTEVNRDVTAEGVLDTIYSLANVTPPAENPEDAFRGHPLAAAPVGAAWVFYGIWPTTVLAGAWVAQRRFV